MNMDGNLKELPNDSCLVFEDLDGNREETTLKEYCGKQPSNNNYFLIPEPDVPFSLIEGKMKELTRLFFYRLQTPQYRFLDSRTALIKRMSPDFERLYYSVLLVNNGSQLIQLAGIDPDVHPPKFNVDFNHLGDSIKDSRYKSGAIHFFTIFVDENGSILGIENHDKENDAIIAALDKATVIAPGTRNGKPVPTAVVVAIPVK
jgi:hypothetical protein